MEAQIRSNQSSLESTKQKAVVRTPILVLGIVLLSLATLGISYASYSRTIENEKLKQTNVKLIKKFNLAYNNETQSNGQEIAVSTKSANNSFFFKPEKTYLEQVNSDVGYKFSYPSDLSYDESSHSLSGEILGSDKIFVEVSTKQLSDCSTDCDVLRELGSVQIDNNPATIYLGAKIDDDTKYHDKYLTYEIEDDQKYFYISYQFDSTEELSIEQIEIFTKIATSFEYNPDLVENPLLKFQYMDLPIAGKPVIYLYPETTQDVNVKLKYNGNLIASYPSYPDQGWTVKAFPDGKLINYSDKKEYSYLFWEGENHWDFSEFSEGFVVPGTETASFLQEKLSEIGLTPKEYNEFIVYWLPLMQNNRFNLIHFAQEEYTDNAILDISPRPDSMLRVFMVYKEIDAPIQIKPQSFEAFVRNGFTVVEWGGTKL